VTEREHCICVPGARPVSRRPAFRRDFDRMIALQQGMRSELWRSDMIALSLPHRDERISSWLDHVGHWVRECVISNVIDAVF
jgi:hypothetical protein